ncbi:hypothetical protein DMN91_010516 [Ooceraea biroi]|uniref:Uncharacterized protein n=1 Tax=Ooceraea biroi TaxID=2015173 RepID=A0A3L8D962_OOCBI|nr:hypothetical protein DMN91_010516 [Ooceraea biroi]
MFRNFSKWLGITNEHQARNAKAKFAIIYAFIGWNCFAVCFYKIIKEQLPDDRIERRKAYKSLIGASENTHVYEIKGLTLEKDFEAKYSAMTVEKDTGCGKIDENL